MTFLKLFVPAFLIPMILDFLWLGFIARSLYLKEFSRVGRIENGKFVPVKWAMFLSYFFIAFAIMSFALPKVADGGIIDASISGALLGFILYGVYNFTNVAVIKDYSRKIAVIDFIWGTFMCAVATMGTKWIDMVVH